MSGGSWNYLCFKMEDAAATLLQSQEPLRRALGRKMSLMADAMHDIEWVDSCDYSPGNEIPAIKAALGTEYKALAMEELIKEHETLIARWKELVEE